MADFFEDKHYNDYFEKLNSRLNSEASGSHTHEEKTLPKKQAHRDKKGIYKTVHIKHSGLIVAVAMMLIVTLVIVLGIRACSNNKPDGTVSIVQSETANSEKKDVLKEKISYTFTDNTVEIPQTNDANAAIIIRKSDNTVVAQRDPHKKIYPASTLKIMTLLTAVEHIKDFDDTFTMTLEITDPLYVEEASVAQFLTGEVITMTDLLYGLILPSGADAAMGLAIKIAGSEEEFVKLMNANAKKMGLKNTHFTNVTGLFDENNYSTCYDMAIILGHAMQNELCRKVLSTYQHTTEKTPQNPDGILLQSTLFSYMYGTEPETAVILGGKTGFVNEAGYCIASFGENISKTEEYIVVTMGNSSKWPAFYGQINLYKEFAK